MEFPTMGEAGRYTEKERYGSAAIVMKPHNAVVGLTLRGSLTEYHRVNGHVMMGGRTVAWEPLSISDVVHG